MSYKRLPKAFGTGRVPASQLPAVEQADIFFTHAYQAMAQANGAVNGVGVLFGEQVALAVSKPVTDAMRAMEALWGAIDTLADESYHAAEPWRLRDALRYRDALVELRHCQTLGCEQRFLLMPVAESTCPDDHEHRTVYAYQGGEDTEPF